MAIMNNMTGQTIADGNILPQGSPPMTMLQMVDQQRELDENRSSIYGNGTSLEAPQTQQSSPAEPPPAQQTQSAPAAPPAQEQRQDRQYTDHQRLSQYWQSAAEQQAQELRQAKGRLDILEKWDRVLQNPDVYGRVQEAILRRNPTPGAPPPASAPAAAPASTTGTVAMAEPNNQVMQYINQLKGEVDELRYHRDTQQNHMAVEVETIKLDKWLDNATRTDPNFRNPEYRDAVLNIALHTRPPTRRNDGTSEPDPIPMDQAYDIFLGRQFQQYRVNQQRQQYSNAPALPVQQQQRAPDHGVVMAPVTRGFGASPPPEEPRPRNMQEATFAAIQSLRDGRYRK